MNSMKRTSTSWSRPNVARSTISSSLTPRSTTALILTGANPASLAASMPSSTLRARRGGSSRSNFGPVERVEADVDPVEPGGAQLVGHAANVAPLVVIASGMRRPSGRAASLRDEHRQVGPHRRLAAGEADAVDPKRSTKIRASRSISSNVSTSLRGSHFMPSSGMQYVQRKLQRSVTEIRRSRMARPKGSTRSVGSHAPSAYEHEHGNVSHRPGSRRRRARSAMASASAVAASWWLPWAPTERDVVAAVVAERAGTRPECTLPSGRRRIPSSLTATQAGRGRAGGDPSSGAAPGGRTARS